MSVERAIDVVFFDLKDTLGEVYRPGELSVGFMPIPTNTVTFRNLSIRTVLPGPMRNA